MTKRQRTVIFGAMLLAAMAATPLIKASAKDWSVIRVGTEGDYPKFSYTDSSGKLHGWDIDLVNALCEQIKAKCEFITMPFDAEIPALLQGKIDMISSINITDERKKRIGFTNKHYNIPNRFVAKKDSGLSVTKQGLSGKTIGVTSWLDPGKLCSDNFADVATIKAYKSQDEANLDLVSGRIDATVAQELILQDQITEQASGRQFCLFWPRVN